MVLGALTLVSWAQMILPNEVPSGGERLMPCCGARFSVAFSMWVVMMAGMMIPSVAPMLLTHAAIMRRRVAQGAPFISSGLFLAGYLLAWSAFSAGAAFAQWALYHSALLDGHSLSIGPWAGGAVLLTAAIFQVSPAKNACLSQCRAPVGYFITEWREGPGGAVTMGLRHGLFCIGCCWLLMAVLFAVGIMNILWGAVITAFVVAEKILPWRRTVVWSGAAICLAGATVLMGRAILAT
jgi:predicted metal-binding membrane protein